MELREMSTNKLIRVKICTLREIKTMQSVIKQIDTELEKRYDDGNLGEDK
jgi:hypothetical protein